MSFKGEKLFLGEGDNRKDEGRDKEGKDGAAGGGKADDELTEEDRRAIGRPLVNPDSLFERCLFFHFTRTSELRELL